MAKSVKFDIEVIKRIGEIARYLEDEFGENVASKFTQAVFSDALLLGHFPKRGMRSQKFPEIRHIKVTKHNRLYYRIDGDDILVIYLFDLRQNPATDPYR